jgi:protein-disulfide isomerase
LVALLAAVAAIFLGGTSQQRPVELSAPTRGDEDAPVVMVEYADFQCPFCGKFARDVEPELVKRYVESGVLRMEWRDFPHLGQESVNAALAARAAQEQGKFWEYHDLLYQNQGPPNSKAFSDEGLIALAEKTGLDTERLESDYTSGKYERVVSQDFLEGQSKGITGTPTFYINGKVLVGAQPAEAFEEAIEEAAREAEDG